MRHPIYRVTQVEHLSDYRIKVAFDDGTAQSIDLEPVLEGKIYGPLRDPEIFRQVRIDPEIRTLVWPNGADFDPRTLHDWPIVREAWIERARAWRAARV